MKGKVKGKIIALASLALATTITFTVAGTAAAFFNYELHNQEIVIDMGYGKYFGGGDGTQASPYQINTSEHLRNLSKLVNIGAFGPEDHFRIMNDITYSGTPLTPIGTSDSPFVSHFDGIVNNNADPSIVRVINDLSVEGNNLADVGMFGYIGNEGFVGNFILNRPVISAKGDTSFDYLHLDKNPLRALFTEAQIKTINITNPVYVQNDIKNGMTKFDVDLSGLPLTYKLGGKDITLNYKFNISNATYLSKVSNANTFEVLATTEDPNTKFKGEYMTLEVYTEAVIYDSVSKTNRFTSFVLERFKLYYDAENDVIVSSPEDIRRYGKMIFTEVKLDEISANEKEAIDFSRAPFVGIVAGRLDGVVDYIGVADSKISILRPFISYSLLIGKSIDDDENRTLSKEEINFHDAFTIHNKNSLTLTEVPQYLEGYRDANGNKIENPDRGKKNNMVNDIYGVDHGMTKNAVNNVRVFATNGSSHYGGQFTTLGTPTATLTKDGTSYIRAEDKVAGETYETGPVKAIQMSKDIDVIYRDERTFGLIWPGFDNIQLSNCISLWISSVNNQSWFQRLIAGETPFYLNIELDYLFFDDTPAIANTDGISTKRLKILGSRRSIGRQKSSDASLIKVNYKSPDTWIIDYTYPTSWKDVYTLEEVPVVGESLSSGFRHATIQNPANPADQKVRDLLRFKHENWAGTTSQVNNPVNPDVQTLKIRIEPKKAGELFSSTAHMPIFFLGVFDDARGDINNSNYDPDLPRDLYPYLFEILGLRVTLSDLQGNIESTLGTIDFIQGGQNPKIPIRASTFDHSKAKVKAQTINNIKNVNISETTVPNFLALHEEAKKNNGVYNDGYIISTSRSGSRVTVKWNVLTDKTPANFAFINPHNTEGFQPATITYDNRLAI